MVDVILVDMIQDSFSKHHRARQLDDTQQDS